VAPEHSSSAQVPGVEGMPESGYAKEIGIREWVVEASDIKWNLSGNESSDLVGIASTAAAVGAAVGII